MAEPPRSGDVLGLGSRLSDFCRFLRSRGFPAGLGAEVELARAVDVINGLDRDQVRAAAVATLANSPEAVAFVRWAFDSFFALESAPAGPPVPAYEVTPLAPRARKHPVPTTRRPAGSREEPPTVAVPLGTYSPSAPATTRTIEALPDRSMRQLRRGARRFRREVSTIPGRRSVRARHGGVDLRDTVRRSLQQSGEWFELRRRRPRPSRADLVILWDVSGSMREHESRFFGLAHALASVSRRGRVFAFSTRLEEITADLRRAGYRRAAAIVGERIGRADGGTRIGRSLEAFVDRYGSALREGTTVLILSDGWDLGESEAVATQIGRIAPLVHRVVWVTPYTRRPGFEPRVGALAAAIDKIDALCGPEDFEARWPLRPYPL